MANYNCCKPEHSDIRCADIIAVRNQFACATQMPNQTAPHHRQQSKSHIPRRWTTNSPKCFFIKRLSNAHRQIIYATLTKHFSKTKYKKIAEPL